MRESNNMEQHDEHIDIAAIGKETQHKIFERIEQLEKEGKFAEPVQGIDFDAMVRVDENYKFLSHNFFFLIWVGIIRFVACWIGPIVTRFVMGTKVRGRENLRALKGKGAVVTCNHVHTLDNMLVREACFGHRIYITVAEFNNRNDFLGWTMRASGTLPFSASIKAMANLNKAITRVLSKGCFLLGYPEQALWMRYEKPRLYSPGMFHIAAANSVAVVPMFITWGEPGAFRKIFSKKKVATIHILEPIFPDATKNRKENTQLLQRRAFEEVVACYTEVYGHAPEYTCSDELSPLNQFKV